MNNNNSMRFNQFYAPSWYMVFSSSNHWIIGYLYIKIKREIEMNEQKKNKGMDLIMACDDRSYFSHFFPLSRQGCSTKRLKSIFEWTTGSNYRTRRENIILLFLLCRVVSKIRNDRHGTIKLRHAVSNHVMYNRVLA
jgi:hypothetical protein